MDTLHKNQITASEMDQFLKEMNVPIAWTPFKKLALRGDFFYVYDEDGEIKKMTLHKEQALKAYNSL